MRVALFGGSFNPVHVGHLALAEEAREACRLDRVVFMPAARPPHKPEAGLAPGRDRMALVQRAIAGNPAFEASDLELLRPGPSYTVETLAALKAALPRHGKLFLILGQDSVLDLPGWREPARILSLAGLIVATRPGFPTAIPRAVRRLLPRGSPPLRAPVRVDVSGTAIRSRLEAGRSVRYLVPDAVLREIRRRGLYGTGER